MLSKSGSVCKRGPTSELSANRVKRDECTAHNLAPGTTLVEEPIGGHPSLRLVTARKRDAEHRTVVGG